MNLRPASLDTRVYKAVGFILIFAIFAAVCFVFVKALVFDRPINDRALQQSLIAAGVGVTISCLMVWLLDVLSVINLRQGWSKLLWSVLVVSILGNSALAYKQWYSKAAGTINVSCLRPLALDKNGRIQEPLKLRENSVFARGEKVAFFASVNGLQTNDDGDYKADIVLSMVDRHVGKARFVQYPFRANKEQYLSRKEREARLAEYRAIAPECVGEQTVFFATEVSNATGTDFALGTHTYDFTIYDLTAGTFGTSETPVTLVGGM